MDTNSEKLIIFENQGELCQRAGERVLERVDFLANCASELIKKDSVLFNQLLNGELEGFEGMYIFEQNPSPQPSGMIETVTLIPLGEKSWGFIVDAKQLDASSDEDIVLALLDESVHAKQRLAKLRNLGRLEATDKAEYEKNEIEARLHVVEAYRELSKEGFSHELYDDLIKYIDLITLEQEANKEILTREIIKDFLIRSGYKFE